MADITGSTYGYTEGIGYGLENKSAYLTGIAATSSLQSAYIGGVLGSGLSRKYAYLSGLLRSSLSSYLGGVIVAVDYIMLKTSDNGATLSKKFRVIAQDYDDGTKEKAESMDRTIGGGVDHSVGAVYTTWSPIIRVRASETETGYGDKDDLEYFYELNNPNGTPSNNITFVDHHQVEYIVHLAGKLTKNMMGCQIEGTEAWFLYRVQMLRVQ